MEESTGLPTGLPVEASTGLMWELTEVSTEKWEVKVGIADMGELRPESEVGSEAEPGLEPELGELGSEAELEQERVVRVGLG